MTHLPSHHWTSMSLNAMSRKGCLSAAFLYLESFHEARFTCLSLSVFPKEKTNNKKLNVTYARTFDFWNFNFKCCHFVKKWHACHFEHVSFEHLIFWSLPSAQQKNSMSLTRVRLVFKAVYFPFFQSSCVCLMFLKFPFQVWSVFLKIDAGIDFHLSSVITYILTCGQ